MTDKTTPVSDLDIANMHNNLNLIRSQAKANHIDPAFIEKQAEKMIGLLERLVAERGQQKESGRFQALYEVSRALGASLDRQTVLDQVMDAIIQLTAAERGFLMLRDDDGGLSVQAARNFDQQTLSADDVKYSRTVVNQVIDDGKPILTTNASEDPRFAGQASIVAQSLRSIMATPLRARGNVIGVAYVDNRAISGLFKPDDLDALDAFSGQAAVALDNAILFDATDQELAHRLEQLRQLRRVDLLLTETLDADKAIAYTLEWACRIGHATTGHLALLDTATGQINAVYHYGTTGDGLPPDDLAAHFPGVAEVLAHGKPLSHISDSHVTLMVPILREQRVIGVVVLQRVDTAPFSEDEQDLVGRVIARAAVAIENARLYAAVQAADHAKTEFVGIVAHDLKAPMNNIAGYAELMLMQGGLSDRHSGYLSQIKDTVQRMEMLVSDLADISRIESGHFLMEPLVVPVVSIVQAVQDGTMPQIKARNHTYIEEVEPDLPDMWVDYYRLLQVLTNLVSNAYKYTPDGGIITLKAFREGDRIAFSVSDTGIGMTSEELTRLGTKFWRAEDRFTRAQPGTGLGFSIASRLVEQMGSHIRIESAKGQGSQFSFSVPSAAALPQ